MFSRIVHVAADGTDVFAGRCLEDDFTNRNDGRRIVEIDDTLRLEAFQRLRRVRPEPDRRTRGAERAAAVERLAGGGLVFVDDRQLVLVESHVGVGDVAVDEVEKSVGLDGDDAVACGVTRREDVCDAGRDALRRRELVVGTVLECHHCLVEWLYLV